MKGFLIAGAGVAAGLLAFAVAASADTVPDVVGLRQDAARPMLERAGFAPRFRYDAGRTAGVCFSQEPGGLADRPRGTAVEVSVGGQEPASEAPATPTTPSTGPAGPGIPPLIDAPPTAPRPPSGTKEAPPASRTPESDWPLPPPNVQAPAAEPAPAVPLGPPLDPLTAAAIPEPLPNRSGPALPNTIQMPEADARTALASWNLNAEATLAAPQLVGRVLNQVPAPGETLAPGETVTIVVGLASLPTMDHHVVPAVEGLPIADAKARIERDGFRAVLRSLPSTPDMSGRVISQNPLPVSLGVKGADVVLRVGRGGHPAAPSAGPLRTPPAVPPTSSTPPTIPSSEGTTPTPPPDLGSPPAGSSGATQEFPGQPTPTVPKPGSPTPTVPTPPAPGTPIPIPPQPGPGTPTPEPPSPQPPAPQPPPPTPQPVAPAEGSTFPRAYGATFQWTSVPGATRYEWELQEEQTGAAWRTIATVVVQETRHRPQRMERGRFRWRVRALTDAATGDWSGYFRLYVY